MFRLDDSMNQAIINQLRCKRMKNEATVIQLHYENSELVQYSKKRALIITRKNNRIKLIYVQKTLIGSSGDKFDQFLRSFEPWLRCLLNFIYLSF